MGLKQLLKRAHRALSTRPHVPMTAEQIGALRMRDAGPHDLDRLARLHVDTFNETHLGPFGSGPSFALRKAQWREKLHELHATNFVIVLETPKQALVGFCWVHPATDNPQWAARLNKIYLLSPYQRQGLGRAMVREAVNRLLANGVTSMALFTEVDNVPACSFYEKLGGERQLDETGKFGGMYGWTDLNTLARRLNS
jgi:ribosomal protein S18 acetylase RimI-like enzyme